MVTHLIYGIIPLYILTPTYIRNPKILCHTLKNESKWDTMNYTSIIGRQPEALIWNSWVSYLPIWRYILQGRNKLVQTCIFRRTIRVHIKEPPNIVITLLWRIMSCLKCMNPEFLIYRVSSISSPNSRQNLSLLISHYNSSWRDLEIEKHSHDY